MLFVFGIRNRLADITANAYQLAGRLDSPVFALDFLLALPGTRSGQSASRLR